MPENGFPELVKIPDLFSIPNIKPAITLIVITLTGYILFMIYIKCRAEPKPGHLTVINRFGKIICSQSSAFIIPVYDYVTYISLVPFSFHIKFSDIINCEGIKLSISATVTADLEKTEGTVLAIAQEFHSTERIQYYIEDNLKAMMSIALLEQKFNAYALASDNDIIASAVIDNLQKEMNQKGIIINSIVIQDIRDGSGIMSRLKTRLIRQ